MAFCPVPDTCMLGTQYTILYVYLYKQEPWRPLKFKTDDIPSHLKAVWGAGEALLKMLALLAQQDDKLVL